LLIYTKRFYE